MGNPAAGTGIVAVRNALTGECMIADVPPKANMRLRAGIAGALVGSAALMAAAIGARLAREATMVARAWKLNGELPA